MKIRSAQESDLQGIVTIQAESWREIYSDVLSEEYLAGQVVEDLEKHWNTVKIRSRDVVLVAQENGILGFIAVWCQDKLYDEPYIDNLHIKSSARSKKLGSVLMKSAATRLIQQGQTTAYLWAAQDNERAIHFYEKLGGVCTDRALQDYFGTMVPNVKIVWSDLAILNDIRL